MGLYQALKSFNAVKKETGYDRKTIREWVQRYNSTGGVERKAGSGRRRKTTAREDRAIAIKTKRNRMATGQEVKDELQLDNLSETTIRRRMASETGFESYWQTKKPFISEQNRLRRREFAREHLEWTDQQWQNVLWSDESPFVLIFNRKQRVWRTKPQ